MTKQLTKIAIVVSHPIQHFCPQYVSFTKNPDARIKVFFGSALGSKKYLDENFKQEIIWSNLNLHLFDHIFLNGEKVLPADKHLDAPTLCKELAEFGPDLLITYGYFQKLQRRARRWALKHGVPIAYISDSERRHKENKVKELLKYFFIKNYFAPIHWFLSMGDANEAYYRHYGVREKQLIRMHYPIDVEFYEQGFKNKEMLREKIRSLYDIRSGETVLAVVGKLVPWKNQDHIIDAMQLLEEKGIYMHLFIIGSGEQLDAYNKKAKLLTRSKVHFTGFVDIAELPGYYAATDVYVHPASLEPHSVAISEAIFMACPVIISDTCGSYGDSDDVQSEKNGFVYSFGDTSSLAEKLALLIRDESKRMAFAGYSHSIARKFQNRSHYLVLTDLLERSNAARRVANKL